MQPPPEHDILSLVWLLGLLQYIPEVGNGTTFFGWKNELRLPSFTAAVSPGSRSLRERNAPIRPARDQSAAFVLAPLRARGS